MRLFQKNVSLENFKNYHSGDAMINLSNRTNIIELKDLDKCISYAKQLIEHGSVIAVPTDTIYGLAVDAQNSNAVKRVYEIKNRIYSKPLAICVANILDISKWGNTDNIPQNLLFDLLPGPVTIVLERSDKLNKNLNPGISGVAIRIPENKFIMKLAKSFGGPIALTSANVSNDKSCVSIDEFHLLWPKLSAIFDGGTIGKDREGSTIVDLSVPNKYKIIRQGINYENIKDILKSYNIMEL